MVLFCSLSNSQRDLYVRITDAWFNKICMQDKSNMHLSVINALKKICNHPNLLVNDKENSQCLLPETTKQKAQDDNFSRYCGKITVVQTLMRNLKKTNEKLVLVSYYTQTLNLLETVCSIEGLKFLRLDGTTLSSTRSKIIEQFNTRTDESSEFCIKAYLLMYACTNAILYMTLQTFASITYRSYCDNQDNSYRGLLVERQGGRSWSEFIRSVKTRVIRFQLESRIGCAGHGKDLEGWAKERRLYL